MSVSLLPSLCIRLFASPLASARACVGRLQMSRCLSFSLSVCMSSCVFACARCSHSSVAVCVCVRARVHLERFQDKQDVIAGYMFHVVIENTQTNCYFTEKVRQRGQTVGMTAHACLPCAPACSFALSLLLCSFFLAPLLFPPPLGTRPPPSLPLSRPPTRARTHC